MRKEGLENRILTGQTGGKRDRRNQCIACLISLNKWMAEQELGEITKRENLLIRVTKDIKLWRVVIVHTRGDTIHKEDVSRCGIYLTYTKDPFSIVAV